ncbi:MAG: PKD domain-containing protein [Methanolinea sp.]|jgi:PKD repeat protein
MDRESAISRNIILALVAAVVIIIAVMVMVMIFFPPQPDVVPQFSANIERSGNVVYLYHDGGDPLQKGNTVVKINGQEIPASSISFLHAQDWPWTPGKTLRIQYDGAGIPSLVQVIYRGGKGEMLVYSDEAAPVQDTPIPITTAASPVATVTAGTTTGAGIIPVETSPTAASGIATIPSGPVAPQPPKASFTADPRAGQLPLVVQFIDTSSGAPTSWQWNFGDGGTSTERAPVYSYKTAGSYPVSLTVRNLYGTSQKTEANYISAGTLPAAQFTAVPTEGTVPLVVQFNDLSTGLPTSYSWDFGDGTLSHDQSPVHTYTKAGVYDVALTVGNQYGYNTRIQSTAVRVTSPEMGEIYLTGSRMGTLLPGYLQFIVTGEGGWIKVAGSTYSFSQGDTVQIFVDNTQSGVIDANALGITDFRFDAVRMYVNGNLVRSGLAGGINVPSYAGLHSTLSLVIPPGDSTTVLFINGGRVLPSSSQQITIRNIGEFTPGHMSLVVKQSSLAFKGGAQSFTFT